MENIRVYQTLLDIREYLISCHCSFSCPSQNHAKVQVTSCEVFIAMPCPLGQVFVCIGPCLVMSSVKHFIVKFKSFMLSCLALPIYFEELNFTSSPCKIPTSVIVGPHPNCLHLCSLNSYLCLSLCCASSCHAKVQAHVFQCSVGILFSRLSQVQSIYSVQSVGTVCYF